MLTLSNALTRDGTSLRLARRFMFVMSAVVTAGILLLTLTPLYDAVVLRLIGAPAEIAVRARGALIAMIPWPAAIAYRRFHQGVMIRLGYTRQVSYGTAVRLCTTLVVSVVGRLWGRLDGATVAGTALGCAVIAEAIYVHCASRTALRRIRGIRSEGPTLTLSELLRFYSPLALTSMIMLSTTPLLNLGLSRSPYPIESLAVWPVVNGQLFIVRSLGYSLQEVIVALWNGPAGAKTLRRFTIVLGAVSILLPLAIAFTSLGPWWQRRVAGLSTELTAFAVPALKCAVLLPGLAVVQSWLRGIIVTSKATGAIAWAIVVNLAVLVTVLLSGASLGWLPGASLAAIALTASQSLESVWLWRGARAGSHRASVLGSAHA
jgi:hypothetical protein